MIFGNSNRKLVVDNGNWQNFMDKIPFLQSTEETTSVEDDDPVKERLEGFTLRQHDCQTSKQRRTKIVLYALLQIFLMVSYALTSFAVVQNMKTLYSHGAYVAYSTSRFCKTSISNMADIALATAKPLRGLQ